MEQLLEVWRSEREADDRAIREELCGDVSRLFLQELLYSARKAACGVVDTRWREDGPPRLTITFSGGRMR